MYQPTNNLNTTSEQVKPFYVYIHKTADTGRVFYVGKGKGDRAFRSDKSRRNHHWHNVVNKHGFTVHIIMRFDREQCALSFEIALIKHYGRSNLTNKTDGGDGVSGLVTPQDVRDKISASLMGRFKGENSPHFGRKVSKETSSKISDSLRGEKHPNYGKKRDPKTVAKIAAANKGKLKSEETKALISQNRKGKMNGSSHHQYDHTVYIFHKKGQLPQICTRYELMKAHDLPSGNLSAMLTGRRKQTFGWSLIGKAYSDGD